MNTAIEVAIYDHVNSTHVSDTRLMNGLGASGDFARNAYTSFFLCSSIKKDDCISTIAPMVSYPDHNPHLVDIITTDLGTADLRVKGPIQCAHEIIKHTAHPAYRPLLREHLNLAKKGHVTHL